MSKIIRHIRQAPTVAIGERLLNVEQEALAERTLRERFPEIAIVINGDGARLIPVDETINMLRALEQDIGAARQAGYDEGFQAGLNQGRQEGQTQAEKILQQFDQAIKDTITQRETILQEARQKVLELVMQISRKVTFDAVVADPDATLTIISKMIDSLVDKSQLHIKVNPDHFPTIKEHVERFLSDPTVLKDISLEPDPRVRYGGCLIETPTGDIDARVESQLDVIEETILAVEEHR